MLPSSSQPIGIFDSGIGGLTVFAAIRGLLPRERLLYLGDTARVPYGTKSAETIVRYALQNAEFLAQHQIKALVVACNTASAHALPLLQERFEIPVMGVVEPGARAAVAATTAKRIGVIGTSSTIESGAYPKAIRQLDQAIHVVTKACPLLVSLVEEGWHDDEIAQQVVKRYLAPFKEEEIDTLLLGCTHYPLLRPVMQRVVGEEITLVDSGAETAFTLKRLLTREKLLSSTPSNDHRLDDHHLFVTDLSPSFTALVEKFFGNDLPTVEGIDVTPDPKKDPS